MFRALATWGLALPVLLAVQPGAGAAEDDAPNEPSAHLSTLGRQPNWSEIEKYQFTITHDESVHRLQEVYASRGCNPDLIQIEPEAARILTDSGTRDYFILRFAKSEAEARPLPRWWTPPSALPAVDAK